MGLVGVGHGCGGEEVEITDEDIGEDVEGGGFCAVDACGAEDLGGRDAR